MVGKPKNVPKSILLISIFAYFMLILCIGLSYHWGYLSTLEDIGTFDQAIWGTLHGDFFLNTHNDFNVPINYLGFHFRPILMIFLPFYAILPKVEWMILAQSLALSLSAWPIYLLAKQVSKSDFAALFWAVAYMVHPFVINVSPWVFRPESLAVPFIAAALLSIEKSNLYLLLLSCFFIVLCKEHFGIMVIGLGILWGLRNRKWKQAMLIISGGTAYSVLVLGLIMPALSPIGKHVMLGEGLGQVSRYSWLGHSLKEVFQSLFFHPISVAKIAVLEMGGGFYLLLLLIFFLGLPLAAPEFLLPGLADLTANMLSANPMPRNAFAYHSVSLIPVFTVAAVYGTERIYRWTKKFTAKEWAVFAAIACFIGGYFLGPLPLPGARNKWAPTNFLNCPDPVLPTVRSVVGDNSSVTAQANIGAHFSQREQIYQYPNKVTQVDVIVLRLESPTSNISNFFNQSINKRKYLTGMLDAHLQMDREDYIASIESLLSNTEYGVSLWQDPWLVFSREAPNYELREKIKQKLKQLRKDWKINIEE